MACDREVIEENEELLMIRWRLLRDGPANMDAAALGLCTDAAAELRSLNEQQVRRAADCAAPLFRLPRIDDVVIGAIDAPLETVKPVKRSPGEEAMEDENFRLLLSRWHNCRFSPVYARTVLGLSDRIIRCFRAATLGDLRRASRQGVRFATFMERPRYLFHAGRNFGLQQSQRTFMAICSSTAGGY